jgi:predicted transcriptional regulator
MSTLTIRLPDETTNRLKALAKSSDLSTNKLIEQMCAYTLAAWDTENHFRALAATGNAQRALDILDRPDADIGFGNHSPLHEEANEQKSKKDPDFRLHHLS